MSGQPYNYDYILKYIIIGDQVCFGISVKIDGFVHSGSWQIMPPAPIYREEVHG